MSLATTGVSQAIPSSSTTPKDSPRSEGVQNTSAPRILAVRSSSEIRPNQLILPSPATRDRSASVSGPSPATQSRTLAGR